jgi:hypothetical protein
LSCIGRLQAGGRNIQFEKHKHEQAHQLEAIKTELSLVARLRGSAEERRAEVAARVLIACLQFLDRLRANTVPGYFGEPGLEAFQKEVNARWQASREVIAEFSKHWVLAETYLSPEVSDLFERSWRLWGEIQIDQGMHFDVNSQGGPKDRTFWNAGFGDSVREKVAVLRDEVKALLRPVAQLEQHSSSPSASGLPNKIGRPTPGTGLPNYYSTPKPSRYFFDVLWSRRGRPGDGIT